jgi:predicted N-acetyltransferase YhbS
MKITFAYLADHRDLISLLATWFHREWGRRNPELTVDKIAEHLEGRLHKNRLPLTFLAFRGNQPVGTASLKIREMEIYPQYAHWLGAVYVSLPFRHQGIGTQIVRHSISEAEKLGVTELYLYTRGSLSFYAQFGWRPLERPFYHGREVVVMKLTLPARLGGAQT